MENGGFSEKRMQEKLNNPSVRISEHSLKDIQNSIAKSFK
ncbi:hypothetical protein MmTuc01_1182 [Methanosarcina mazei Tuc01]|uniref:Uncharacterized protein n=1 Tax=Methanosarcina mazei Tuc01 TaxID=1236903 RepID=M1PWF6_METMZ|nr:hypothetical protein MmTuc01_1182 [Methanosarcina mazei Tuc01]